MGHHIVRPYGIAPEKIRHGRGAGRRGIVELTDSLSLVKGNPPSVRVNVCFAPSLAKSLYGEEHIEERHRHRYEVNIAYREKLEAAGLKMSGLSPDGLLPEIVEREDHPWFVAVQFHPELKSKPFSPHPLFVGFVAAAREKSRLV